RPCGVGRLDLEAALENVGRDGEHVVGVGGLAEAPRTSRAEALLAHQARDTLAAGGHALALQDGVHAGAAVASTAPLVDDLDALRERQVRPGARRGVPSLPGVEAAARHRELRAHELDGETRLLGLDERELHLLVSFAKKAAALFKKSRSIFSTRTSFRSACSS